MGFRPANLWLEWLNCSTSLVAQYYSHGGRSETCPRTIAGLIAVACGKSKPRGRRIKHTQNYGWDYCSLSKGPWPSGKLLVFRTWMPAL
jgi:hypothetical protein